MTTSNQTTVDLDAPCPCGSGKSARECCAPLVFDGVVSKRPDAVMRSRYSAFVWKNDEYLARSWHPQSRPDDVSVSDDIQWTGLSVGLCRFLSSIEATVDFVAHGKELDTGKEFELKEQSLFIRFKGAWLYYDGQAEITYLSNES